MIEHIYLILTYIILYSIEGFLRVLFVSTITEKNFNKNAYFATILIAALGVTATKILFNFIHIVYLNLVFGALLIWLSYYFILKLNKTKSIYLTIYTMLSIMICEGLALFFINFFMKINSTEILSNNLYSIKHKLPYIILGSTMVYLFFTIFIYTIRLFKIKVKPMVFFNTNNHNKILRPSVNLIATLFITVPNFIILATNFSAFGIIFCIYNVLILIILFLANIYITNSSTELDTKTHELYNSEIYNRSLLGMIDGIKLFKHDFNNIVQGIGGYLTMNDLDGLKNYYSNILKDCKALNNLNYLSPDLINEPCIYSIISAKYYDALEKNILFDIDITCNVKEINLDTYYLSRILGILLDNAIEAASNLNKGFVKLSIKCSFNDSGDIITISNSCENNKDCDINKYFEKGFSTKKIKSGLGLWEVKKIVDKFTNLDLNTKKEDNIFTQTLLVYK